MYICLEKQHLQTSYETYWEQMAKGDKKAYEQVFVGYYELLCRYAYTVVRDKDEAEEVVQNLFYNVWRKREELSVQSSVKSYLYRAVRNDCLNRIKHNKVRSSYAADYRHVAEVSGNGLEGLEAKELASRINLAIETLPTQCATVFKLSRFEQLSYAEIAGKLDISIKTVEVHMGKALKRLREQLQDFLTVVIILLLFWGNK